MLSQKRGMVSVLLASAIAGLVVTGFATYYYLTQRNSPNIEDKLAAISIGKMEFEKVSQMSASEINSKKEKLETGYASGDYFVKFAIGESGGFKNGICNPSVSSSSYDKCFKDSFVVVSKNGETLYASRMLPLIAGNYSRSELHEILKSYVRNNNYDEKSGKGELAFNVVEKEDDKLAIEAYYDGESVSFYQSKELMGPPDTGQKIAISLPYTVPENGYIFIHHATGGSKTRVDAINAAGEYSGVVLDFSTVGMAWSPVTKGDYLYFVSRSIHLNINTPYFMPCVKVKT